MRNEPKTTILSVGSAPAAAACSASAGLACGLTYGELIQDAEAKKLLILFREAPSPARRACVYQWAHKRHMKLVVIDSIKFPEE